MGNLRTLDKNPRKFSILSAGGQKFLGICSSFRDLAKSVHWKNTKIPKNSWEIRGR